jgi:BMFP domain-containing protein YqiC
MPSKKKLKAVVSSLRNEVEALSLKVSQLEAKLNEQASLLYIQSPTQEAKEPQFDPKQVEENLGVIIS